MKTAILGLEEDVIKIIAEEPAITAAVVMEVRLAEADFLEWLSEIAADIPLPRAIQLARAWGPEGIAPARENPYVLLAITNWVTVEAIAGAIGLGAQ